MCNSYSTRGLDQMTPARHARSQSRRPIVRAAAMAGALLLAAAVGTSIQAHAATAVYCPSRNAIIGTVGDDIISGTPGDDLICAGPGNDTIAGEGGNDRVWADPGNDSITTGAGTDSVI